MSYYVVRLDTVTKSNELAGVNRQRRSSLEFRSNLRNRRKNQMNTAGNEVRSRQYFMGTLLL